MQEGMDSIQEEMQKGNFKFKLEKVIYFVVFAFFFSFLFHFLIVILTFQLALNRISYVYQDRVIEGSAIGIRNERNPSNFVQYSNGNTAYSYTPFSLCYAQSKLRLFLFFNCLFLNFYSIHFAFY